MEPKIRWGVLGWARIARTQVVPALVASANGTFHALASRSAEKRAECAAAHPGVRLHASYDELLADDTVDAIYNPLPNALHKEWTIRAAERGKHVLCEKPVALTAAEAREMVAACRANGVQFMEAFMYRYSDRTRQVVETVRSGVLGDIRVVHAQFRFRLNRPGDVRRAAALGGGSLFDVGCYPVNFVGLVLDTAAGAAPGAGPAPVAVQARAHDVAGIDEQFSALLTYPGGTVAAIHSGFNAQFRMHAEIVGTDGVLEVPQAFLGTAGALTLVTGDQRRELPVAETDRYRLQAEDFAAAIRERRAPRLAADEALRNIALIERLYAAARS